jgi:hypothetical protein
VRITPRISAAAGHGLALAIPVAFLKVYLIGSEFMEVRTAPRALRLRVRGLLMVSDRYANHYLPAMTVYTGLTRPDLAATVCDTRHNTS